MYVRIVFSTRKADEEGNTCTECPRDRERLVGTSRRKLAHLLDEPLVHENPFPLIDDRQPLCVPNSRLLRKASCRAGQGEKGGEGGQG